METGARASVVPTELDAVITSALPMPQRESQASPSRDEAIGAATYVSEEAMPSGDGVAASKTQPVTEIVASAEFTGYPRWPAYCLVLVALVGVMKWAQPFLVPVVVAILIFYALVLPVDALERLHVPRALGAALVVMALVAATSMTMWAVWAQLDRIAEAVPRAVVELKTRWGAMKYDRDSTLSKLQGSADAVQRAISSDAVAPEVAPAPSGARARMTVPAPPVTYAATGGGVFERFAWSGTVTVMEALSTLAATYLLAYFLLVDGNNFRRKWMGYGDKALSTRRVTVQALNEIDLSVRKYLAMLFISNALLGALTYLALLAVGVEDAAGWGVLAGLLHIIPYFGPILVAGGVFVTSLHQLGNVESAVYAALATMLVATVVGTFAQTWMTARIARMSASVVFVSILLFGWLWGGAGLLLAVPIAVIVKVVMTAVPSLNPIGQLLGDVRRKK
jgi:predicted PurR-regulated permease PerM